MARHHRDGIFSPEGPDQSEELSPVPRRTLTYWRTQWLGGAAPGYHHLEAVCRGLLNALPSPADSRVARSEGVIEVRRRRVLEDAPVLLHCAAYTPGAEGSVVPHNGQEATVPLRTIPPPKDADFLNGALMALIKDNHCLLCSDGLSAAALRFYLQQLAIRCHLPPQTRQLDLVAVANREKIEEIIKSGVQEVGLSATLDELDVETTQEPETLVEHIKAEVKEATMTLIGSEARVGKLLAKDFSNINAKLIISFNQRKHGTVTQEVFDRVALDAANEEDKNLYIKLRSGSRIEYENMKLTKRVDINMVGTTIDHNETWERLEEFYAELVAENKIEL